MLNKLRIINSISIQNNTLYTLLGTTYGVYHYSEYCIKKELFNEYKTKPFSDDEIEIQKKRKIYLESLEDERTWEEFKELSSLRKEENKFPSDVEIAKYNKVFNRERKTTFFMYSDNSSKVINLMVASLLFTTIATTASKIPVVSIPLFVGFLTTRLFENKSL